MCKSKFKKSEMRGFPLSRINEELGTTKDIESILIPVDGEEILLHRITENEDDDDEHDVIVNSWMKRLREGYQVWFEPLFNADVAARLTVEDDVAEPPETPALEAVANEPRLSTQLEELTGRVQQFQERVDRWEGQQHEERIDSLEGQLDALEGRFDSLEERLRKVEGTIEGGSKRVSKRKRNA